MAIFCILLMVNVYKAACVPLEQIELVTYKQSRLWAGKEKIYLDKWSREVGGELLISRHRQEDWLVEADWHTHTREHAHTQSHAHNLVLAYTAAIFLRRGKTISHTDLSLLCVRQKSLSGSNLSRSASVARASSMLFHPAASCWRTQHLTGSLERWLNYDCATSWPDLSCTHSEQWTKKMLLSNDEAMQGCFKRKWKLYLPWF